MTDNTRQNTLHLLIGHTISTVVYEDFTNLNSNPSVSLFFRFHDHSVLQVRKNLPEYSMIVNNKEELSTLLQDDVLNGRNITRIDSNITRKEHDGLLFSSHYLWTFHLDNGVQFNVDFTHYSMINANHDPEFQLSVVEPSPSLDCKRYLIEVPVGFSSYE